MSKENIFKEIKILMYIIFFILLIPMVISPKPTIPQSLNGGLEISYPNPYYLEKNINLSVRFWVYNLTTGDIMTNITVNCTYNLLDDVGKDILKVTSPSQIHFGNLGNNACVSCFNFEISGGNFSYDGYYNYQIRCHSPGNYGGFISGDYDVSNSGNEITTAKSIIDIGILLILIIFFMISIYIFVSFDNLLARVSCIGLGYLFLIGITFTAWIISDDFLISASFLADMFYILFIVLIIGFFPLIIGGFAWYVLMLFKIKEIRRLMGKGMNYEDAERRQGRKYK